MKEKCKCELETSYSVMAISCLAQIMNSSTNNCRGIVMLYGRLRLSCRREPALLSLNFSVTRQTQVLSGTFAISARNRVHIFLLQPASGVLKVMLRVLCNLVYKLSFQQNFALLCNIKLRYCPFKIAGHVQFRWRCQKMSPF